MGCTLHARWTNPPCALTAPVGNAYADICKPGVISKL